MNWFNIYLCKTLKTITESAKGRIAKKPKGSNGFGWDSIFIHDGITKTRGEMTDQQYHQTSLRRIAALKMEEFLNEYWR